MLHTLSIIPRGFVPWESKQRSVVGDGWNQSSLQNFARINTFLERRFPSLTAFTKRGMARKSHLLRRTEIFNTST